MKPSRAIVPLVIAVAILLVGGILGSALYMGHLWRSGRMLPLIQSMVLSLSGRGQENRGDRVVLRVQIKDSADNPVPHARAGLRHRDFQSISFDFEDATNGLIIFRDRYLHSDFKTGNIKTSPYDLLVYANGFAPATSEVMLAENREISVTLQEGKHMELQLLPADGHPIPAGIEPCIFHAPFENSATSFYVDSSNARWGGDTFNMAGVVEIEPGRYAFQLPDDLPSEIFVGVNHQGFLRGYRAGPFSRDDLSDGHIEAQLPSPATVAVTFKPSADAPSQSVTHTNCGVRIHGTNMLITYERASSSLDFVVDDLAPGPYNLWAYTGSEHGPRMGPFNERRDVELAGGRRETVDFIFHPFDEQQIRGDRAAAIRLRNQDGSPAAGRTYALDYYDKLHGQQVAAQGKIPNDGVIHIEQLADKNYSLTVDDQYIGKVGLLGANPVKEFDFSFPPLAGDPLPDITVFDLFTGAPIKLRDLKGQVLYIEFWNSYRYRDEHDWMGDLEREVADDVPGWKGKARVIAVSFNRFQKEAQDFVRAKKWEYVEFTWAGDQPGKDWNSAPMKTMVITSDFTGFLVDRDGRIVWRGMRLWPDHPDYVRVADKVNELLRQE